VNAILSSLDASSKRWLTAFAVAAVVTIGVLAHSFLSALAPPKEVADKPQQSPLVRVGKTYTSSQPTWNSAQQNRSTEYPNNIPPTPPSERYATTPVTPTNWGDVVHVQAEYLRELVRRNGNRDGSNAVTEADIAEWEKNGMLIQ
jgi:hypothetical protein